ncbi:MAG: matrixin family metalloprotease [Caldilineaceae bacterium]|nr:matrixin family metalloprotease [Caldilineaceae bacterium]
MLPKWFYYCFGFMFVVMCMSGSKVSLWANSAIIDYQQNVDSDPNIHNSGFQIFLPTVFNAEEPTTLYDDASPPSFLIGASWERNRVTYAFQNSTDDIADNGEHQAVREAFRIWQTAKALDFVEVALAENPDITISWRSGNHGDGAPFDGPGYTLAHATYPHSRDGTYIHFDEEETWTTSTVSGNSQPIDLVTVAIHEIGHALGLGHSHETTAIMYAYYGGSRRTLHNDDINGIRALYPSPAVEFTANEREGQDSLTVQFTDQSTNSPTTWFWDFGDGTTSNEQNPTHTYTTHGVYDVTLSATNRFGSQQQTKPGYIVVHQTPPPPQHTCTIRIGDDGNTWTIEATLSERNRPAEYPDVPASSFIRSTSGPCYFEVYNSTEFGGRMVTLGTDLTERIRAGLGGLDDSGETWRVRSVKIYLAELESNTGRALCELRLGGGGARMTYLAGAGGLQLGHVPGMNRTSYLAGVDPAQNGNTGCFAYFNTQTSFCDTRQSHMDIYTPGNLAHDPGYRTRSLYMRYTDRGTFEGKTSRLCGNTMLPGDELGREQMLRSNNGNYQLIMQNDGNLVLYKNGTQALWASWTHGGPAERLTMQGDGNLVLYTDDYQAIWATWTFGDNYYLILQDDGNLVIYRGDGVAIWHTGTFGP